MKESDIQLRLKEAEAEIRRLRRAIDELSVLNDLASSIGGSMDSDEIISTIVRRSLRSIHAEQGVITLVEPEEESGMRTIVRTMYRAEDQASYHLHQSLLGWMQIHRTPLAIADPASDERFRGTAWDRSIHSLLCVPLLVKSRLTGILTLYNKSGGECFSEEDQRLLAIIASQSAQVIENARLNEQEKALLRMQEEVRHAARIQMDLLPKSAPLIPGYDVMGMTIPAQSVGGDYFDFIPCGRGETAICVGDVTGKGLPASLLMANVQATLRGLTLAGTSVKSCIERSNALFLESTDPQKFVTLFYGRLSPDEGLLRYTNAGHDHPILIDREGRVRRLATGGTVLGIVEEFPFEEEEIGLEKGSTLVAYSDGITEARNGEAVLFGEERLLDLIARQRGGTARELGDAIIGAVRSFAGNCPQSDDMTIVIIRRLEA